MDIIDVISEQEANDLLQIEDTLRMENLDFSFEHVSEDCQCEGKKCSGKCKQVLCIGSFYSNKSTKDKLSYECRSCVSAYRREYRQSHKDIVNGRTRRWKRENQERVRGYQRAYRQAHEQEIKTYRRANRAQGRVLAKRSYQRNPDIHRIRGKEGSRIRQEQKAHAGNSYTKAEWEVLKTKYNYTCLCCGKREPEIKLTTDHIIPLSKMGSDGISNIQPLCPSCNSSKKDQIIDYRTS